jgi:MoxR-like ATPase
MPALPASIDAVESLLNAGDYVADRPLATTLFLALKMGRPLFLEGEAGVGKTEIAKVLAATLNRRLVRLQCYEGGDKAKLGRDLFSRDFLIERPLLQALQPDEHGAAPVLLIDELDRTDEPFEAYLLEVLSDFQITIPEIGAIKAAEPPIVIITSNRTREIHDALKRRCLYYWVDYPNAERELAILDRKVPGAPQRLSREIVAFVQHLREAELFKLPGVAETIDWTRALAFLDKVSLDPETIDNTLGVLLKYQDDIAKMKGSEAAGILRQVQQDMAASGL